MGWLPDHTSVTVLSIFASKNYLSLLFSCLASSYHGGFVENRYSRRWPFGHVLSVWQQRCLQAWRFRKAKLKNKQTEELAIQQIKLRTPPIVLGHAVSGGTVGWTCDSLNMVFLCYLSFASFLLLPVPSHSSFFFAESPRHISPALNFPPLVVFLLAW